LEPALNELYLAWNCAIAEWFFGYAQAGRPAYLAVDDDELWELAAEWGLGNGSPAGTLAEAVGAAISRGGGLTHITRAAREWRKGGASGDPPYLALLALCVLAGSRMAADPPAGIAAHAYYPQLNTLLGRDVHAGMPPWFPATDDLWLDLNEWLEKRCGGSRGLPSARTHPWFTHIGWPLSQCLFRAADRHRLPDFFRSAGLEPATEVEPAQLWVLFRHWARPGCGLTDQGLRVVGGANGQVAEHISEILKHELDTWDGDLRDPKGRRRGEVLLILEKWAGGRRAELRFVARRPRGFPEGEFRLGDARSLVVETANVDWYQPLELPVNPTELRHGLTATQGVFSLAYDPAVAVPFRACLEPFSAWLSCRQANALEEHSVLVHASALADVRGLLMRYARAGWRELQQPAGNIPAGWTVIERVHLSAVPHDVAPHLSSLAPRLYTAMRLEGGLPLSSGIYLVGGEPDLWITVEPGERCVIDIDGEQQELSEGAIELRLADLHLPAGKHEVSADGVRRRLTTERGFGLPATFGTASLGHVLRRHRNYQPVSEIATPLLGGGIPPGGTVHVCGAATLASAADLPRGDRPPELLPTGFDEYVVLGDEAGQLVVPLAPERPAWLDRLGLSAWQFFDVPLTFRPKWLIYRGRAGTRVHRWGDQETQPSCASSGPLTTHEVLWARHLITAAGEDPIVDERDLSLWETYVCVAESMQLERAAA
jgi:hypothetical protein